MKQLCRLIGVTRVADVTTLDRAGVRVCCAIRPAGHVLQVSNGKGDHAELSAVAEAAELWAAEQDESDRWTFIDGVAHVQARRLDAGGENAELGAGARASERGAARRSRALAERPETWAPAQSVWCPPAGTPSMGRPAARWTSNGMGAHADLKRALLHGLLEVIERHALTETLPEGWTEPVAKKRCVAHAGAWPGFTVRAFDLTPRGCPVAIAGALVADDEGGPIPLTAGYAARVSFDDAVRAAIEEAFQSRLTDVQGAREDVTLGRAPEAPAWLAKLKPVTRGRDAKVRSVAAIAKALRRPVAAVELVPGRLPLRVVKVFVDGYRVSELLG